MSSLNRRQIFRLGASAAAAPAFLQAQSKEPRSIIYMVADGMSPGVIPLAEQFSKLVRGRGTVWNQLLTKPGITRGFMDMASLNSMVTDSSAASSSWGSGSRIFNAMLNVLPDGTKLTPIGTLAREKAKRRIGLVTTATVTHATPAGFAAVSSRRDDEDLIATQYLDNVDVVLGGGKRFFDASKRKDKRDLAGDFAKAGYKVSYLREDLKSAPGAKLLGLYDDSHVQYVVDQRSDKKMQREIPSLAEMAQAALTALDAAPNGFLLQIEGARVDHAAHANDAAGLLWEQLAFDDAIQVVLDYCQKRPDTLVVITSDHGNANPGLFGVGKEYEHSNQAFELLTKAKYSYTTITRRLGNAVEYKGLTTNAQRGIIKPNADLVHQVLEDDLGLKISEDEARLLRTAISRGQFVCVNKQLDNVPGVLGQVIGNHTGIGWVGTTHTSDYTISTAFGPGSELFAGLIRNTDVFVKLTGLLGISFKNPTMDAQKAMQYVASVPRRERVDWA
ncbi:MAG: alkaline phosphatase [Acidobacteria bacterium]|nr:alkaline phosphatase [Acidobacteriota bacterium]